MEVASLKFRRIRNESDYRLYTEEIKKLTSKESADRSQEDKDNLDMIIYLVESFEKEHFPIDTPSCIEAIKFRMEQQNLSQKDLVPYIGSRSRVSEILAGKRKLTKDMIKSLNKGLDIPLDSLLNELPNEDPPNDMTQEATKYPLAKMRKFGWIDCPSSEIKKNPQEALDEFFAPLGNSFRQSPVFAHAGIASQRVGDSVSRHSLLAWVAQVCRKAKKRNYVPVQDSNFLNQVVRLSVSEKAPLKVQSFLADNGISLVIERHLPTTRLDGAAIRYEDTAIIGMTLRYDRIDNFWFTLLHELAHIQRHFSGNDQCFVDDLDFHSYGIDPREAEADKCAYEAILPSEIWQTSRAFNSRDEWEIKKLARENNIHHALLFGRLQRELDDYRTFRHLVGQGTIRMLFDDVRWD